MNFRWTKKVEETSTTTSPMFLQAIFRIPLNFRPTKHAPGDSQIIVDEIQTNMHINENRLFNIIVRYKPNLPYYFLYNGFIFINHMIRQGQNRVFEEGVGTKVELEFENLKVICPKPLDVLKMFESGFIIVFNLIQNNNNNNNKRSY